MEAASTKNSGGELDAFSFFLFGQALAVLALVTTYYLFSLPHGLAGGVMGTVTAISLLRYRKALLQRFLSLFVIDKSALILVTEFLTIFLLVLGVIVYHATSESVTSPWEVLPYSIWPLYGLLVGVYILIRDKIPSVYQRIITFLLLALSFSVVAILLPVGFGYDRFVHEATVRYIVEHGDITPKQPYYLGLYIPIIAIHELTTISIKNLFTWFLPVVAALSLTLVVKGDQWQKRTLAPLLLLYAPFTFTVPFNAVVLLYPLSLTLLQNGSHFTALLLALVAITIHPLGGTFLFALLFGAIARKKYPHWLTLIGSFFVSLVAILGPFYLYYRLGGGTILPFTTEGLFGTIDILFRSPVQWRQAFWHPLSIVYAYFYLWPTVIAFIGITELLRTSKQQTIFHVSQAFALILGAIIVASQFRFFDIVAGEQYEFAFRLVSLAPWVFFIPFTQAIARLKHWLIYPAIIATLFISYPQFNAHIPFYAPTVSALDIKTVDWIDERRGDKSLTVLAPQLVSAAALRKHGFNESIKTSEGDIYPYAIPTGDTLYRYYLEFLSGERMTETLIDVTQFTKTQYLFIVVDPGWDPYGVLAYYLTGISESSVQFEEGRQVFYLTTSQSFVNER